ncbi:2-oxo acid dehydrogenase subunit E2 [Bacillus sp. SL00103]
MFILGFTLDNGLAVPVIQHAERLTLIELAKSIKLYGKKHVKESFFMTKSEVLPLPITSLGAYGVEHFTPILNPPEAGILGIGTMYDTVYREDEL